jgi:hypothetical protein
MVKRQANCSTEEYCELLGSQQSLQRVPTLKRRHKLKLDVPRNDGIMSIQTQTLLRSTKM